MSTFNPTMIHCPLLDIYLSSQVMGAISRHCRIPYGHYRLCLPLQSTSSSSIPSSSSRWLISGVRLLTTTQEATYPSSPDTCQGHTAPDHINKKMRAATRSHSITDHMKHTSLRPSQQILWSSRGGGTSKHDTRHSQHLNSHRAPRPQHYSQRHISRCILVAATPPRDNTTALTWAYYQETPGHTEQLHHRTPPR